MLERPIKMEIDSKGVIRKIIGFGDITRAVRYVEPPQPGDRERLFIFKVVEAEVEIFIND